MGGVGDYVRHLSRELGVSDRVRFTGWVDYQDLASFYAGADVFVFPARWPEAFGDVSVEANSYGLPVVAYDRGGIGSWLDSGRNGLLVAPGDVSKMAEALRYLLDG